MELCKKYGFDAQAIRTRLALLGLGPPDQPLAVALQRDVIAPHASAIIDGFYDALLQDVGFVHILESGNHDLARLKSTQRDFLLGLGLGFDAPRYFEERLRVGAVHARVNVPLSLYLCAYRLLTQLIIDRFPSVITEDPIRQGDLLAFLLKAVTLDMSLAVETYHKARVRNLEQSLDTMLSQDEALRVKLDTDALTGLITHERAITLLEEALARFNRDGEPVCLIMADLDRFKLVNDNYGHLVGDKVLKDVAARLRAAIRDFDTAGRYGGEEFVVILHNTALERGKEIAERIRVRVSESPVHAQDAPRPVPITISQGLTEALPGDTIETLIGRADAALYTAKRAGRNCVKLGRGKPRSAASRQQQ